MAATSTTDEPRPRRRRRFGVLRILVAALLLIVLAAGLTLWIVTRSWFLVAKIGPELERRLGADVTIGEVVYDGDGRFVLSGVVLSSREHGGTGAEVLTVGTGYFLVDAAELTSGKVRFLEIELEDVLLRLSEDARHSGSFSLMSLRPTLPEDGESALPPIVKIRRAAIEVGVHDGDTYHAVGRRMVAGELAPIPGGDRWLGFTLHETDAAGRRLTTGGISVTGRWNPIRNELKSHVERLDLDESTYGMCPALARVWWDRMGLEGQVANARLGWSDEQPLQFEFDIENVGLTLPVESGGLWARYRDGEVETAERPRMVVTGGRMKLDRHGLTLEDLVGEVRGTWENDENVAVPYRVSLTIPQLPDFDWNQRDAWLDEVLDTVPFELRMDMQSFSVRRDHEGRMPSVLLPYEVAEFLTRFQLRDWNLSSRFVIRRPVNGTGEIETTGRAHLTQARGAFHKFPYPLEEVEASIEFDQNQVVINDLSGRGPNGGWVHVDGRIEALGRDPRVKLNLLATDGPLDDALRTALKPWCGELFDTLLNEQCAASLREAGLLDDAFELAGHIDLDLQIDREPGQPTITTGRIRVVSSGLLCDKFPYPVTIEGGEFRWTRDRVQIVTDATGRGIAVRTPGGGVGSISGHVDIDRAPGGATTLVPALEIDVQGDRINELMLASIPMSDTETAALPENVRWPGRGRSEAATFLEMMDVRGRLDYSGTIGAADDGELRFTFNLDISDGVAEVTERLLRQVGLDGLDWPENWAFVDVTGRLVVSNDGITVEGVRGEHPGARAEASGHIGLDSTAAQARLTVALSDVAMERRLFGVLDERSAETAERFWDRYRPEGRFDARLVYHRTGDEHRIASLEILPRPVTLHLGDQAVTLTRRDGLVRVRPDELDLRDLRFDVHTGDRADGTIDLEGTYRGAGDAWDLTASWSAGRFECPLIGEGRRLVQPDAELDPATFDPAGDFEAALWYGSSADVAADYHVDLKPASLAFTLDDERLEFDVDEGSLITATPGRIGIERLDLEHAGGRLEVAGVVRLEDRIDADLRVSGQGRLASPQIQTLMGAAGRRTLAAIEFTDGQDSRFEDVQFRIIDLADGDGPSRWLVDVDGTIEARSVSFDAGVDVSEMDGRVELHLRRDPDRPLELDLGVHETSFTMLGHRVEAATARMRLEAGGRFRIEEIRGKLYGGGIWSQATIGTGDDPAYEMTVHLVGVALDPFLGRPDMTLLPPDHARIYAGLDLGGRRDEPGRRLGRGVVRLLGDVIEVPLIVKMMQIPHLSLPGSDLRYGETDFFIEGDRLEFENILFESFIGDAAPLQLLGQGHLNLDTFEVSTRFRTRGGWLLVRDVLGAIGDQLYVIEVSGPLGDPDAALVPLPGLNPQSKGETTSEPIAAVRE